MLEEPLPEDLARYVAWFHELDAWTEYWDIYHPETKGRFYFGNEKDEDGLLTAFLPNRAYPPAFRAWRAVALKGDPPSQELFVRELSRPTVAAATHEVDGLLRDLFSKHFGEASSREVCRDYLQAMYLFATDTLPAAHEREARLPLGDPRRRTAGRHTLDGDIMWFGWALHLEAAQHLCGGEGSSRRALMMAGVASGCPANFAWRGHRRTRSEYPPEPSTRALLLERGQAWAKDFQGAAAEVHALFRLREWGEPC